MLVRQLIRFIVFGLPLAILCYSSLTASFAAEFSNEDSALVKNVIYNGDLSLGNSGFAVSRVLDGERPPVEKYISFAIEKNSTGEHGNVFKINPVKNCLAWTLFTKDTYLTSGKKKIACDVFMEAGGEPLWIWMGIREAYGKKQVQVSGKSVRIVPGEWNRLEVPCTVTRSGFFTIEIDWIAKTTKDSSTKKYPDKILIERKDGKYQSSPILFDNFVIDNEQASRPKKKPRTFFDIAIHTNKTPPVYGLGEKVVLTFQVKAPMPGMSPVKHKLVCKISQDESTSVAKNLTVNLTASPDGIWVGTATFKAFKYGAFSVTAISLNNTRLNAVAMGGDFAVIHKLQKRTDIQVRDLRSKIQTGKELRQITYGFFARSRHTLRLNYADPKTLLNAIEELGVGEIRSQGFVDWRTVEREQGVFRLKGHQAWAKAFAQRGIRLQASLGGQCFGRETLPDFIQKGSPLSRYPQKHEAHLPPLQLWKKYVEVCVDALHQYMPIWEINGEPQWGLTAEEYTPYLKSAYTLIKKKDPKLKVIGFGLTGDGQNLLGGFARHGITLDLVKWVDGVAFHPYGAGLDYDKFGQSMAFTTLLTDLKRMYQPFDLSLYDTELYYVVNTPPGMSSLIGGHLFTSADLIRHVLIGLGNGLEQVSASTVDSYFKNRLLAHSKHIPSVTRMEIIPNARYVAINYVAKLLEGLDHAENFGGRTPLFHRYLFSDHASVDGAADKKDVGVIWYSSPNEQTMIIPSPEGISFYDYFGNPISIDTQARELTVGLTPIYLKANDSLLRKFISKLSLRVVKTKQVTTWRTLKYWDTASMKGAIPKDIRLYYNKKSGIDMTIEIDQTNSTVTGTNALRIQCKKASLRQNQIDGQLSFFYRRRLSKGKRYRISFWAKASSEMKIFPIARLSYKPWSNLGAGARKGFYLTENWQHCVYEFTSSLVGEKGIQVPGMMIGNFDTGMTLWLSKIVFEEKE